MSMFMFYSGITQGNASDAAGHKNWIPILEFEWGSSRQITSATSTQRDRESTNARISDLKIHKWMDSSTPKLFLEACCGTGKNVILRLTKTGTGSGADVYMEYKLVRHEAVS
ncbi:MAG: type VI secretion system tube protein Hcp [Gammaproteobacteria bacterium]|nr:type VI secretion system tube protein Hcp [Gammaproteobacteria bacterium]